MVLGLLWRALPLPSQYLPCVDGGQSLEGGFCALPRVVSVLCATSPPCPAIYLFIYYCVPVPVGVELGLPATMPLL
jgi:hypothetical protein